MAEKAAPAGLFRPWARLGTFPRNVGCDIEGCTCRPAALTAVRHGRRGVPETYDVCTPHGLWLMVMAGWELRGFHLPQTHVARGAHTPLECLRIDAETQRMLYAEGQEDSPEIPLHEWLRYQNSGVAVPEGFDVIWTKFPEGLSVRVETTTAEDPTAPPYVRAYVSSSAFVVPAKYAARGATDALDCLLLDLCDAPMDDAICLEDWLARVNRGLPREGCVSIAVPDLPESVQVRMVGDLTLLTLRED